MSTENVRDLLYDYVCGKLSKENVEKVEVQLALSGELREELHRVRNYVDAVNAVEKHVPPDDFLQKVYARIETNSQKGILQKLFVPLHVKVPVELAGVFATLILVVFLFVPHFEKEKRYNEEVGGFVERVPEPFQSPAFEKVDTDKFETKDSNTDKIISFPKSRTVNEKGNSFKRKEMSVNAVPQTSPPEKRQPLLKKSKRADVIDEGGAGGSQKDAKAISGLSMGTPLKQSAGFETMQKGGNSAEDGFAELGESEQNISPPQPQSSLSRNLLEESNAFVRNSRKSDFLLTIDMSPKVHKKSKELQATRRKTLREPSKINDESFAEKGDRKNELQDLLYNEYSTESNSSLVLSIIEQYCQTWSITDSSSKMIEYLLTIKVTDVEAFLQEIKSIGVITRSGVIPQTSAPESESLNIHLKVSNHSSTTLK